MKTKFLLNLFFLSSLGLLNFSCGSKQNQNSNLDWEKSREGSDRYAHLWTRDLEDEFFFGASVIEVDDFLSNALNMTIRPIKTKLALSRDESQNIKLHVTVDQGGQPASVMAFDVNQDGDRLEVDFASAGNDIRLRGLIDAVGGQFTAADSKGQWISQSQPRVESISQDNDTVVVNLRHRVEQVLLDDNGEVKEVLSDKPGDVVVRIWLKRKLSLPTLPSKAARSIAQGKSRNIGYFASNFIGESNQPIQRFPIGDAGKGNRITFYLKDFPKKFTNVARKAILSWNHAFKERPIEVKIAPSHIDVGDPRYHVIKWFDGTDKKLRWAGVAKMITDPDTGLVMSGGVYIQGNTLINLYEGIIGFSEQAAQVDIKPTGQIGRIDFSLDEGEVPVIPYFTDLSVSFDEYMQGYYHETIAHEIGHVLGLRHNFRGSANLDKQGHSASVMDYAPRADRNRYEKPGSYDLAAIRWGYYGEEPRQKLAFCTDDDVDSFWDCNQGDFGDPVAYVTRAIVDGTNLLEQTPIPVEEDSWIKSMQGAVKNANKMLKLAHQLPNRQEAVRRLATAIVYAENAQPSADLSSKEQAIVRKNLAVLKKILEEED